MVGFLVGSTTNTLRRAHNAGFNLVRPHLELDVVKDFKASMFGLKPIKGKFVLCGEAWWILWVPMTFSRLALQNRNWATGHISIGKTG